MSTQSKTDPEVLVTPEESVLPRRPPVMKAILFDRFGGTEVLHEASIEPSGKKASPWISDLCPSRVMSS